MQLNKNELNLLGILFGTIAGITLIIQAIIDGKIAGVISGIAILLLGIIVQHPESEEATTSQRQEDEN